MRGQEGACVVIRALPCHCCSRSGDPSVRRPAEVRERLCSVCCEARTVLAAGELPWATLQGGHTFCPHTAAERLPGRAPPARGPRHC